MDWLFEGHVAVYLFLGVMGLFCFALWWYGQDTRPPVASPKRRAEDEALAEWDAQVKRRRLGSTATLPPKEVKTPDSPPSGPNVLRLVCLIAFLLVLLLAGTYFVLDRLVETRREQITRKLQEMSDAIKAKDMKKIMSHLSPRFKYFGKTREEFEKRGKDALDEPVVDECPIWGLRFDEEKPNQVILTAKPKGRRSPGIHFLVRTEWVQDPDGEWRMSSFSVANPFIDSKEPLPLPHLGGP
jgi:hypothetical protein